ncbi:hypothetical protein FRC01_010423 [Tulasnella sp. 417]|nr:hypothetical protein FRC01_010423 [Tulasnella sp. 417]
MLVCKAWYSLIRGTPKYWTSIAIGVGGVVGWPGGPKLPEGSSQEGWLAETLKQVLQRSAQLPIQVSVAPERIWDLEVVTNALHRHAGRVSSLSLLGVEGGDPEPKPIPAEQIEGLLNTDFPALEQFAFGNLDITPPSDHQSDGYTVYLTAPRLRQLACDLQFISPRSTSYLTHLSLASLSSDLLYFGLTPVPVELPQLLKLSLSDCDPDEMLPILVTPALQTLIVSKHHSGGSFTAKPPQYANLRELQWTDVGHEGCFIEMLELSPNLTRYSNYAFGIEEGLDLGEGPATIFSIIGTPRELNIRCPKLKEVCLDRADCAEMKRLIRAFPSIQFLRILQEVFNDDEYAEEVKILEELIGKVDLIAGRGSWRGDGDAGVNES